MKKLLVTVLLLTLLGCHSADKEIARIDLDLTMGMSMLITVSSACIKVENGAWPKDYDEIKQFLHSQDSSINTSNITEYLVKMNNQDIYEVSYIYNGREKENWSLVINSNGSKATYTGTPNRTTEMKSVPFKTIEGCKKSLSKFIQKRT